MASEAGYSKVVAYLRRERHGRPAWVWAVAAFGVGNAIGSILREAM